MAIKPLQNTIYDYYLWGIQLIKVIDIDPPK